MAVQLDLSAVTFVDSVGLGIFVKMKRELEARGGHLQLVSVPRRVQRVLAVSRLDEVLLGEPS